MAGESVEVFFSYSHKDEVLRDELANHLSILKRRGEITTWHDRQIEAGTEWDKEIDSHLQTADIILLLISSAFLASDYCWSVELEQAMARHEAGEARVIPIILRPVDWKGAPFSKLQALPRNAKAVTLWANQDEAFVNIAQGIRTAIEGIPKQPEPTLTSSLILSGEEVAKVKTEPKVTVEEDLSSEKGVNYIRLRDLLKVNKWRDADYETYLMMLQAVGRQKGDWIRSEELANFPLTDLRTVNQLWMKYSNGHFGFSVQKRIYESIGGHLDGEYDYQTLEKFGDRVQWRINSSWITYNSLIFSLNAPEGYLPVLPCGFGIREWEKGRSFWIGWGLSDLRLSSLLQHQDL